jgi:multidrug transporter EmrE-like cation transporter
VLPPTLATACLVALSLDVPGSMSLRWRKFFGTFALLILVVVWALVAMAFAQMPAIRDNAILSVAYYVIAGLGWCLPAMPIVTWMSREPRGDA